MSMKGSIAMCNSARHLKMLYLAAGAALVAALSLHLTSPPVAAGNLGNLSLTLTSTTAGATGVNVTTQFTTATTLPSDGKIVMTFPSGFSLAAASFGNSLLISGVSDGHFGITASGQVLTLSRLGNGDDIPAGTSLIVIMGSVTNPVVTASNITISIATQTGSGTELDTGSAQVTITPGSLSNATVTPASLVAGATGNVAVSFTTDNPIPADGRMEIAFPSGFSLTGVNSATSSTIGGGLTASVSSQTVTVQRDNTGSQVAADAAVSLTLATVQNPVVSGSTGTYTVTTQDSSGASIDTATPAANTITTGALTRASLSLSTTAPSQDDAAATFSFTTANPLPADGKIVLVFPSGFSLSAISGQTATGLSGVDGTLTASVSGSTLTLTRSGGTQLAAGTALSFVLSSLQNPTTSGTTSTFSVTTENSSSTEIDAATLAGQTIAVGALTSPEVSLSSTTAGRSEVAATVVFTTVNPLPANGRIVVTLPSGFDAGVADGRAAGTISGIDGTLAISAKTTTLTITRSGGTQIAAGTTVSLSVPNTIDLPSAPGKYGALTIATQNASGLTIDSATFGDVGIRAATSTSTAAPATAAATPAPAPTQTPVPSTATTQMTEVSPGRVQLVSKTTGQAITEVAVGTMSATGEVIPLGFVRDTTLGQTYAIVRRASDGLIVRKWVSPDSLLRFMVPWDEINSEQTFSVDIISAIPLDESFPSPGQLARRFDGGDDRVFYYDGAVGLWRHVPDVATFQAFGLYWCDITSADAATSERMQIGPPLDPSPLPARADYPSCR